MVLAATWGLSPAICMAQGVKPPWDLAPHNDDKHWGLLSCCPEPAGKRWWRRSHPAGWLEVPAS